jgi:ABC-type dipeptide/oligopeptide/nickel transport system permease component/outer membrane protein assembly factor BamB
VSGAGRPGRCGPGRLVVATFALVAVATLLVPGGSGTGGSPDAVPHGAASPALTAALGYDSIGGWVSAGGSANRSGFTPLGGPLSSQTGNTYCPSQFPIQAGPVAAGAFVFVADVLGNVFAINRTDLDRGGGNGTVVWTASVGGAPTTPDVSSGLLVIGDDSGAISTFDPTTGERDWTHTFPYGGIADGVAVVRGTIYSGTLGGSVFAAGLSTGTVNWTASLDAPVSGAVAVSGGLVYAATIRGDLYALSAATGAVAWTASIGGALGTGPAVLGDRVVLADNDSAVAVWNAQNGSLLWRWNGSAAFPGDRIEASPVITPTTVFVQTHEANLYAFNASNGALRWNQSNVVYASGYPALSAPAATPTVVYVFDATEQLKAISLETGRVLWRASYFTPSYGPVAIDSGEAMVADETGCLHVVGSASSGISWPVRGTVADPNGTPLAGVQIYTGVTTNTTNLSGGFFFVLPNGTYTVAFALNGYAELSLPLVVTGPVPSLPVVLDPLALYPLVATVEDADSGHGVANVTVDVYGVAEFLAVRVSGPGGTLALGVPAGPVTLNAQSSGTHAAAATTFVMPAGPFGGVIVAVAPTDLAVPASDPYDAYLLAPIALLGVVGTGFWAVAARSRRVTLGLPPGLLSPFARYVAQRALLLPVQMVVLLTVLYIFGTFLPAAATNSPVCVASGAAGCGYCSWSDPVCVAQAFGSGYWTFIANLFTGAWGNSQYGHLTEPAWTFLHWYLPDSLELAAVALTISAVSAYVLGLSAGWNRDGYVDTGVRGASALGVLLPSFLVALVIFTIVYDPFVRTYGDTPFGILPGPGWFEATGGNVPGWIGLAYNTSPTGFPIVDAVLHGAWQAALITATKTILQALLIAAIYVPLYLRFARHAVAQAAEEPSVVAARARGIPESTIRWHHTGRRVVPIFLLAFAATLPLYIGTQSLVEALANDPGVGSLLLSEMTGYLSTGFGFHSAAGTVKPGNFYQVTIFLVVAVVLVASLMSEVLSRYLDPRAGRRELT